MRAIVVKPPKPGVEIRDIETPREVGRVRIRTVETGICGTDREIVNGELGYAEPPPGRDWLVLGHEALGVVEEGFGEFREGDLVMPVNRRGCGHCLNCLVGRADHCESGEFLEAGIHGLDGFMRESWYDEPRYLVKVPWSIRDIAIMAQPLSDIEKSVEEMLTIQRRLLWTCDDGTYNCRKALVVGTGPVGILFALLLRTYGFQVWATNKREPREHEASIFEETQINYYNSAGGYDELVRKEGPFDIVVEASGATATLITQLVRVLKRNGILGLFGFPRTGEASMDFRLAQAIVERSYVIVGLINGQKPHFQQALVHLAAWKSMWPKVTKHLITRVVSIEDETEVINVLKNKVPGEIKTVIRWG